MNYGRKTVVFFEIDQPFCSLSYGEAPCAAKVGVTGVRKCYQTPFTCQDPENIALGTLTLRFTRDDDGLPLEYGPLFACLDSVSTSPGRINIGGMEDNSAAFGKREGVTVKLRDFRWSDHLVDKYRLERTFVPGQQFAGYELPGKALPTFGSRARARPELEVALGDFLGYDDQALVPYKRGTFWSRWVARNPFYPTMNCRVREGYVGQALSEMRVRHYVMDRVEGPTDGVITLVAQDAFSKVESRKALAPHVSIGSLAGAITGTPSTFTVTTGTGNLLPEEGGYSTITGAVQGWVSIGAKEIKKVTRSGDTFTVVQHGALGTTPSDHAQGDSVQLVLAFEADLSHEIAYTLLTGYTELASALIDKPEWDELAATVVEQFTAYIAEPTPVEELLGELMMQAGFTIWPNVSTGMIRYAALRSGAVSPSVTDRGWIIDGSLSVRRRDDKRISQVIVYYVKRSPLTDLDARTSYAARIITPGPGANPYGTDSVREVFSRWITTGGQETARKCGERIFAMYRDPPLEAKFQQDTRHAGDLVEAQYFSFETSEVQDDVGDVKPVAMTPVSIRRGENTEDVDAMSVRFAEDSEDPVRRVFIDTDEFNLNLRTLHDSQYAAPVGGEVIEFILASGVTVGSTSTATGAIDRGSWPGDVSISLINHGRIQAKGGAGGAGGEGADGFVISGSTGETGGPALVTTGPIVVDNTDGEIWGGGGGGGGGGGTWYSRLFFGGSVCLGFGWGGGGGGGGAGTNSGSGAAGAATNGGTGTSGSAEGGGSGAAGGADGDYAGSGGQGGAPGQAGAAGTTGGIVNCCGGCAVAGGGAGGAAGNYIVGNALVTWVAMGDVRGGVA